MPYSRFVSHKELDACLHPVFVSKNGVGLYVPCGKCDGCKVFKANNWSVRLGNEIDSNPYSIFFTLTYSNEFVPRIYDVSHEDSFKYVPLWDNMRFQPSIRFVNNEFVVKGMRVRRDDCFCVEVDQRYIIPISNFVPPIKSKSRSDVVPYPSKRDIVLWLKSLRKLIELKFHGEEFFRYYIISELGGDRYRPHYHGIVFPSSFRCAEYLKNYALFACWQMCDQTLFDEYCTYCDGRTSGYLTQYITLPADLPQIYKHSSTKNFRLASKSPAIGLGQFSKAEVFESVFRGSLEYTKSVKRLRGSSVFVYPAQIGNTFFPKVRGFGRLSFDRLCEVYGFLLTEYRRKGFLDNSLCRRLSSLDPSTYLAQRCCFKTCLEFGFDVFTYVFLVDQWYYLREMRKLKLWYQWQMDQRSLFDIALSYYNLKDYAMMRPDSLWFDTLPNVDISYFVNNSYEIRKVSLSDDLYESELSDVLVQSNKMRSYHELISDSYLYY